MGAARREARVGRGAPGDRLVQEAGDALLARRHEQGVALGRIRRARRDAGAEERRRARWRTSTVALRPRPVASPRHLVQRSPS